jgi:hypothetical protein
MRKIILCLGLSLFSFGVLAGESAVFSVSSSALSCTPPLISAGSHLKLKLAAGHGRELAVRRLADNAWFFLVVSDSSPSEPQLMPVDVFAASRNVAIPATVISIPTGKTSPERVFSGLGKYEVYVSENLESEIGGFKCTVQVVGMSPNNSFKPNPLRGSA